MEVESANETVLVKDGVVQLAFDLSSSDAAYLIISKPDVGNAGEFFGADHYVEVKDQLYGRYGGLTNLSIFSDRTFSIELSSDVAEIGRAMSITTAKPMTEQLLQHLRSLERS